MSCTLLPGQRKHTNDTKISWDSGEAYQGRDAGPTFNFLYFHPVGILTGSSELTEGTRDRMVVVVVVESCLSFAM